MNSSQHIIVIGASAGGVETLIEVVARLPTELPAPVFVVLHIPPFVASSLPEILSRAGPLPAVHPKDGKVINSGVMACAPPPAITTVSPLLTDIKPIASRHIVLRVRLKIPASLAPRGYSPLVQFSEDGKAVTSVTETHFTVT
jgi:hypothetical protein